MGSCAAELFESAERADHAFYRLISKIYQLQQDYRVFTILVMGGSDDYFDVADTVIVMTEFQPENVTEQAKAITQVYKINCAIKGGQTFSENS